MTRRRDAGENDRDSRATYNIRTRRIGGAGVLARSVGRLAQHIFQLCYLLNRFRSQ